MECTISLLNSTMLFDMFGLAACRTKDKKNSPPLLVSKVGFEALAYQQFSYGSSPASASAFLTTTTGAISPTSAHLDYIGA